MPCKIVSIQQHEESDLLGVRTADLTAETLKMDTPRPYIVGWQRYLVHSVDENTGETLWKVTYGKMRGVGPNEGKLSGEQTLLSHSQYHWR